MGEREALDLWPVARPDPDGGLLLLPIGSSPVILRGILHDTLICLCFWIPLAIVVALV